LPGGLPPGDLGRGLKSNVSKKVGRLEAPWPPLDLRDWRPNLGVRPGFITSVSGWWFPMADQASENTPNPIIMIILFAFWWPMK
jgi:hypothetical protein